MKTLFIWVCAMTLTSFSSFAQKDNSQKNSPASAVYYTCSMHPDVKMDKPGKCPKCGMDLAISKKEQMKSDVTNSYSCPVHTDVRSTQPGKCPKCGKDLHATPKDQMKSEVMNGYSCPMHPGEISKTPGKCPKCGMTLTKKS